MKRLFLAVALLVINTSAFAVNNWSYMVCKGVDTGGRDVYLTAHTDSSFVNINGDILRIVGVTKDGTGVVTEDFIATTGVLVYDSIVPTSRISLNIYQFNAVTNDLLAMAKLYCTFYGNTRNENVMNNAMFTALKSNKPLATPATLQALPVRK